MPDFHDFIACTSKSSDPGMVNINPKVSVFAPTFCTMHEDGYTDTNLPIEQQFKHAISGQDSIFPHELKIHRSVGTFDLLFTDLTACPIAPSHLYTDQPNRKVESFRPKPRGRKCLP